MKKILCIALAALLLLPFCGVSAEEAAPAAPLPFTLPCRGAILIEQNTGEVLYESGADEALPIASVTKVMTLLLTMEALEAGTVSLEEKVPVSELAASMGGSQVYLEPGEKITLHEVLKAVFVSSANDGAVALAELVSGSFDGFVARMNERARELGMTNTVFYNPTGLDDNETNLSSARDVAVMSRELLKYEKTKEYASIWIDSIRGGSFGLSNTNKLIRFYPGATGLKTGSTGKAKYCVSASAERAGLKLCAVVLGGESSADRFNAAKTMLDYGFANYAYFEPEPYKGGAIPVWGGTASSVETGAALEGLLLPKADAVGLAARVELATELTAPVEAGQIVGRVIYEKSGAEIRSVPVTALAAVPRISYGGIFLKLLHAAFCGE